MIKIVRFAIFYLCDDLRIFRNNFQTQKIYILFYLVLFVKTIWWDDTIYDGSMRFHVIECKLEADQNIRRYSVRWAKFQNVRGHKWSFANFRDCIPERLISLLIRQLAVGQIGLFLHLCIDQSVKSFLFKLKKQHGTHVLHTTLAQITVSRGSYINKLSQSLVLFIFCETNPFV